MKKPFSLFTTWTIRILLTIIVLFAILLAILSMVGGTSESHRRGLEQAFSDNLNADVKIGQIERFNVLPQLAIDVSNIGGTFRETKNQFKMDRLAISFSFGDLMLGKQTIDDFSLENFRLSKDSAIDLNIIRAAIDPKKSQFAVLGKFSQEDFELFLNLSSNNRKPASYTLKKENNFTGNYGSLEFDGVLLKEEEKFIRDMAIYSDKKKVATAQGLRGDKNLALNIQCEEKIPEKVKNEFGKLSSLSYIKLSENCLK